MLKIMVVDDEAIERDGILFLIKKYKLPMEVRLADNGEEALDLLRTDPVDILLTDIKMPFMDGIQLAQEARKLYGDIKIILLSAYGEFEFARKAIEIKVLHYLLKPIDTVEFQKVLSDVIAQCETEREEETAFHCEKGLLNLLQGVPLSAVENQEFHFTDESTFVLLLIDIRERFFDSFNEEFKAFFQKLLSGFPGLRIISANLNEFQEALLFVFRTGYDPAVVQSFSGKLLGNIQNCTKAAVTILIGSPLKNVDELHEEYSRLDELLDYRFFNDGNMIIAADSTGSRASGSDDDLLKAMNNLKTDIASADFKKIELSVDSFFNLLKGQELLSKTYVKYLCADLIKEMTKKLDQRNTVDLKLTVEKVFQCRSLLELRQIVVSVYTALQTGRGSSGDEANKKVIDDVIRLLETEYAKDISLDKIANQVYLSPSYLSYLFKKETGLSIVKYLTSIRMEKAKDYMLNTNMKVSDVGLAVGYENNTYFGITFRNYFGLSPAQFRQTANR